ALPEATVQMIVEGKGVPPEAARMAAELSGGSAATALDLADTEATKERRAFIEAALGALRSSDLSAAVALSDARARDKEPLRDGLSALAAHFARIGRNVVSDDPARAARAARGHGVVAQAIDELERNGSPALVLEAMVVRLRHELY